VHVAVTGATGFVGRHVVAELSRRNIRPVIVMHPDDPGSPAVRDLDKVTVDLCNFGDAGQLYTQMGCPDVLIHLAWGGLPNYKSSHHIEQELPSQKRFLREMIQSGVSSVAVSGTCFEYGMQSGELSETMEPKPDNPYGTAKNELRSYLEELQTSLSFSLMWARFFYLYGEGQSSRSLFSLLKTAVERGDATFDMSGGEQVRDFLPVEQAVSDFVSLALQQKNVGVVNLCSGSPVSVKNLVEKWLTENEWQIDLNLGVYPYPEYEPMEFWGCADKSNRLLERA